jgi:amino acid transporter
MTISLNLEEIDMRRTWWLRGLKFALLAVLALAAVGAVVMALWNVLMPGLFGWPVIGFWQALGLLVLSKILLGGLRGGRGGRMYWRARMTDRWAEMSDEERAKFRHGMRHRCGRGDPAQAPSA